MSGTHGWNGNVIILPLDNKTIFYLYKIRILDFCLLQLFMVMMEYG